MIILQKLSTLITTTSRFYKIDDHYIFDNETQEVFSLDKINEKTLHFLEDYHRQSIIKRNNNGCVQINLSNRCNLNCTYCYRNKQSTEVMSLETFRKLISWAVRTNPNVNSYVFSFCMSSESSVDFNLIKEFKQEIEKFRKENHIKQKFTIWFMTNGTCASDEYISFIKEQGWQPLGISIDGDEISNKDRVGTNYPQLLENIKKFKDNGLYLRAYVTITSEHHKILDTIDYLRSVGFVAFQFALVRNNQLTEETVNSIISEIDRVYEKLKEGVINKDPTYFNTLYGDSMLVPLELLALGSRVYKPCGATPVVEPNGDVYPCLYLSNEKFKLGNVDGVVKARVFNPVNKVENCKTCWARYLCGGNCYAENYIKNGDVYKVNELTCKIKKHKIEKCLELYLLLRKNKFTKSDIIKFIEPF